MSELIKLPTHSDHRGHLTVLEKCLPFIIRRAYWIYDVKNMVRGGHRHKKTIQALICLNGSVEVKTVIREEKKTFLLDKPDLCLLVPPEDWHTLENHSVQTVLLVLASHEYDENDYESDPL